VQTILYNHCKFINITVDKT